MSLLPRLGLQAFLFLAIPMHGHAALEVGDDWQVRGYLSQGYFDTSEPVNYGGDSSQGSTDIRNVGLNISNASLLDNIRFAGQVTYRGLGSFDESDVELDFLLIDYTLVSDFDSLMGLEIGRLKTHFGFFVSGWDVVHTRPFAVLPIPFYQEGLREFLYSADALRFYARFHAVGYWRFELMHGKPAGDIDKFMQTFPQDTRYELSGDFTAALLHYEADNGLLDGYFGFGSVETPASWQYLDRFGLSPDDPTAEISWLQFGLRFNYYAFYALGEIRFIEFDFTNTLPQNFLAFLPQNLTEFSIVKPLQYYAALGYRFENNVEVYGYFGQIWFDRDSKDGERLAELTSGAPRVYYLRDISVGVRWDITNGLMLGAQWHRMNGLMGLSYEENSDFDSLPEQWNFLNLVVSYNF